MNYDEHKRRRAKVRAAPVLTSEPTVRGVFSPPELPTGIKRRAADGSIVEFYLLGELATYCGRSTVSFRKMEEKKMFPPANLRDAPVKLRDGSEREGARWYSRALVEKIGPILHQFVNGRKTPDSLLQQLRDAFAEEKRILFTK